VIGDKPQASMPLTVLTANGKVERPKMKSADPVDSFALELTEALRTVKTGQPSSLLDGELARDAVILCEKQTLSLAKGRLVSV